jgi:ferredoxin
MLDLGGLGELIDELNARGYEVWAPVVQDDVVGHDRIESVEELPVGWTDEQAPGRYRLVPRSDQSRFGYAVGPQSWKELLQPARTKVWTMTREESGSLRIRMARTESVPRAFLGVRPCEMAAIHKQDRILREGPHVDPSYDALRSGSFIITVNCTDPAATCFCSSMGTGPGAGPGHDLALTELLEGGSVRFVVDIGSERGAGLIDAVQKRRATDVEIQAARAVVEAAEAVITRTLDAEGVRDVLYQNLESTRWDNIADRCLSCANCTLACPTCFCTNLEDVTDLSGDNTDRWRVWDSCFSLEYSHLGPGPHRASTKSRYRQWLMHKLASWIDQFDESGCVGCGRCITWCPVGIDFTAEVPRLAESTAHGNTS